ncbi:hypothetical protein OTK49_01970 [Vibrio coralliirubri]|uniref:A1S_2505 family phage non-structural protein n=1 Tax=Vibrio coralliirubri TaxID=1516159 RepID=UPI002284EBB9|nr:hypothetical protein [Vibrio coralliirubri]MCY9861281.1 hypothetical protein [Vibrio coralliirubri]
MKQQLKFWSGEAISKPIPIVHDNVILCVGTNTQGRSKKGLAETALYHWGAEYGKARGLCGRCYLLVTKNLKKGFYEEETGITYNRYGRFSVSKEQIKANIMEMYEVAKEHPDKSFVIPYIKDKSNLNGYTSLEIINLFVVNMDVPENIVFHNSWKDYILSIIYKAAA